MAIVAFRSGTTNNHRKVKWSINEWIDSKCIGYLRHGSAAAESRSSCGKVRFERGSKSMPVKCEIIGKTVVSSQTLHCISRRFLIFGRYKFIQNSHQFRCSILLFASRSPSARRLALSAIRNSSTSVGPSIGALPMNCQIKHGLLIIVIGNRCRSNW